ncbi:hypothetical protein EDD86DRAFT_250542 [Gorgonomyces haynaldii]|nr:hypothetical protein EDD86DRAFT_250542 [Gorgonomyces haynaldii]
MQALVSLVSREDWLQYSQQILKESPSEIMFQIRHKIEYIYTQKVSDQLCFTVFDACVRNMLLGLHLVAEDLDLYHWAVIQNIRDPCHPSIWLAFRRLFQDIQVSLIRNFYLLSDRDMEHLLHLYHHKPLDPFLRRVLVHLDTHQRHLNLEPLLDWLSQFQYKFIAKHLILHPSRITRSNFQLVEQWLIESMDSLPKELIPSIVQFGSPQLMEHLFLITEPHVMLKLQESLLPFKWQCELDASDSRDLSMAKMNHLLINNLKTRETVLLHQWTSDPVLGAQSLLLLYQMNIQVKKVYDKKALHLWTPDEVTIQVIQLLHHHSIYDYFDVLGLERIPY